MARMLSLAVERKDSKAKNNALREKGILPAVFYGPKEASTPVTIPGAQFKKVWKEAGESSVIILKDGSNEHEALIYDIDIHPVTGEPRHVDFYVIEKGKKVEVSVALSFTGVSPAVKDKGGILVKVQREVKVEAAPRDLPREIVVDISKLVEPTDTIHAGDLALPKGVELKISPDEVVASIAEAKEEVIEAPVAVDMSAIEVEAKGKEAKESAKDGEAPTGSKSADSKVAETKKSAGSKKSSEAKK